MKFSSVLFSVFLGFCSFCYAESEHLHEAKLLDIKGVGNCEIEIINQSGEAVRIYGSFDDGSNLRSFIVDAADESSHYISLYYYDYCHTGMEIYIDRLDGGNRYSGYMHRDKPFTLQAVVNAS